MLWINIAFLILTLTGAILIGIAARYRTEYYQHWLKFNPFALYRVWERKREFTGIGYRLHVVGVIIFTVGIVIIGIKGGISLFNLLS